MSAVRKVVILVLQAGSIKPLPGVPRILESDIVESSAEEDAHVPQLWVLINSVADCWERDVGHDVVGAECRCSVEKHGGCKTTT